MFEASQQQHNVNSQYTRTLIKVVEHAGIERLRTILDIRMRSEASR